MSSAGCLGNGMILLSTRRRYISCGPVRWVSNSNPNFLNILATARCFNGLRTAKAYSLRTYLYGKCCTFLPADIQKFLQQASHARHRLPVSFPLRETPGKCRARGNIATILIQLQNDRVSFHRARSIRNSDGRVKKAAAPWTAPYPQAQFARSTDAERPPEGAA